MSLRHNLYSAVVFNRWMSYSMNMRMVRALCLLATMAIVASYAEETKPLDNYRSIIDRNPFGLKPPPPPPEPAAPPPAPPDKKSEFYLTGISSIGFPKRPKRAYLLNKDNSKKDYDEKFYTLEIGEKQGDVALKEIDQKGRRVKIAYRGEEQWLSMKDNAPPTSGGPAPGMPGVPGVPGAPGVHPPGMPGNGPVPAGAMPLPSAAPTANYQNPNRRTPRTMNGNNGNNGGFNGGYAPAANGGFANNGGNVPVNEQPAAPVDTAAQYFNMKMQEAAAQKQGEVSPPAPPQPEGGPAPPGLPSL